MDQSRRSYVLLKLAAASPTAEEKCKKPDEMDEKGKTENDTRRKSNRVKKELIKKIRNYLEVPEGNKSTLGLRLTQFPMMPHYLTRKDDPSESSVRKRKKLKVGKKVKEICELANRKEKIDNFNEKISKESTTSIENFLGFCRAKVKVLDDRRNEILSALPILRTEVKMVKGNAPEKHVNRTDSNLSRAIPKIYPEKPRNASRSLKHNKSPGIDTYFNYKSILTQKQKGNIDLEAELPKVYINQILKGHARKVSEHSLQTNSMYNVTEYIGKAKKEDTGRSNVTNPTSNVINSASNINKSLEKSDDPPKKPPEEECMEMEMAVDVEESVLEMQAEETIDDDYMVKKSADNIYKVTSASKQANRTKSDLSEKVKSPQEIVASVIEKFNNPFKAEANKIGVKNDANKTGEQKSVGKAMSEVILKTAVRKQRSLREATIDDQVNKSVEMIGKKSGRSTELRDIVAQAIKEHKIFCIFDSHWYIVRPIREELLNRGWLEVIPEKRLIPRRRPPPAGPTVERNPNPDFAIEAFVTAREAINDDYTDDLETAPPTKVTADKPKMLRKPSEDSIKEVYSDFRIVPPSPEKKKTNQEIRDFAGKFNVPRKQSVRQKDKKECESSESTTEHEEAPKDSRISLTESEAKIASKIIQSSNARIHFMWLSIKPSIHLKCFSYSPEIVNKFQRTTFCTKIGLWSHLNNIQWYAHEVTFPAKSPRMYNTGEADDLQAFFQDFQLTACIGMLKWFSETYFDKGMKGVQKKKGKVPIKAFEFAIRQCERYIRFRENEDLNLLDDQRTMQDEWNTFLQWFYAITNDHGKLQETSSTQLTIVYTKALEVLRAMRRHWPEMDVDGRLNIWIMKPYCASCGRGIFMTNNVYYIGQHSKYIVQKYIEKPLLIYNTKFDIRQWFMVTKLVPLEVWMYKECYLRFCTQPFVLRNLHESVHLSNNSVQRKYLNQKDTGLPDQNMWDSSTFQQYLKTIGHPNVWDEVIYPGMRDAIISLMLASQDTFDNQRRSWFEVYGADFMISSNIKDGPYLIEINESPAMDPSTKVTAKLCPQMLRDVIKVVVDKRANKNALTGQWELVYRQNYSPSYGITSADVKGRRIARATQNKTGYNTNWGPAPTLNSSRAYNTENTKKYEILKTFKSTKGGGNGGGGSSGGNSATENNAKSKIWGNRARGRLIKGVKGGKKSNENNSVIMIPSIASGNEGSEQESLGTIRVEPFLPTDYET